MKSISGLTVKSILMLIAMMITGLCASAAEHLAEKHSLTDLEHVISLLGVFGSVLGAWLTTNPFSASQKKD